MFIFYDKLLRDWNLVDIRRVLIERSDQYFLNFTDDNNNNLMYIIYKKYDLY